MTAHLIEAAFYHSHHSAMGGLGSMIVHALVRGLIYGVIYKLIAHMSLLGTLLLAGAVIGGLAVFAFLKDRRRG